MNLVTKIATRFVVSKNASFDPLAHGFISFIANISIAGLALGVTALLMVSSVMNGFERELKKALTTFHGHILLFSKAEPLSNYENQINEMKKNFPDVIGISPYIFSEVMLSSSKGVAGAVIEGFHPPTLREVSQIEGKIIEGFLPKKNKDIPEKEVALGVEIARKLQVGIGDEVILTVPFGKNGSAPIIEKLKVVGILKLGMYEYDKKYALLELSNVQNILGFGNKVNAFKILTKDATKSNFTTFALNNHYSYPLRARDWSNINRNVLYAIKHQKIVISIILFAIVLVASFNIVSTIMMMVHDKRQQVSILKALGFTPKQTLKVFVLIGCAMSFLGTLLGLGLGRALCVLLEWKSIIDLPADVYFLSRVPVEIRVQEWLMICVFTIALALVAVLWPSYRVSRENPVEGLRYE